MKYKELKVLFLFTIIGFGIYFNSLQNAFVFDDAHLIFKNSFIRSFWFIPYYFKGLLTSAADRCLGIRPLVMLSFNFNYFLSGYNVMSYHILNILIHVFNTFLLYLLLVNLFPGIRKVVALLVSLLFLTHPINAEAVSYISSRSDLLVTSFMLLSFYYYLLWERREDNKFLNLSLLFCIFAFLSKEFALSLPIFLSLYVWIKLGKTEFRKRIRELMPYFLIAICYLGYRVLLYQKNTFGCSGGKELWLNILTQAKVSFFYLRLFLWPDKLSIDHQNLRIDNPYDFWLLIILVVIFGILFLSKWQRIKMGCFWFFCFLLPKFIATLNFPSMEHHFYLPSIGFYMLLVSILNRIFLKFSTIFLFVLLFLVFGFSLLTFSRNWEWRNERVVLESSLREDPQALYSLYRLGITYEKMGNYKKALNLLTRIFTAGASQRITAQTMVQIADIYRMRREYEKAVSITESALKILPGYLPAYHQLGLIFLMKGENEEALKYFQNEIEGTDNKAGVCLRIAEDFISKGDYEEAVRFLEKSLLFNPRQGEAYFNLAKILERKGENEKAVQYCRKGVKLLPFSYPVRFKLATLYALAENEEAVQEFKMAIKLNPKASEAYFYLGTIMLQEGNRKGELFLKKAIQLDPYFAAAYFNLGVFYFGIQDKSRALFYLNKARDLGYIVPAGLQIND